MLSKRRILLLIVFLSFGCTHILSGQFFQGKLLDQTSNEPIVFATIRLKERALGVISNEDGSFRVPLSFQEKGSALEISCMGYQSQIIPLSQLEQATTNLIYLTPSLFQLAETTVQGRRGRRPTAKQIIRYAIQNIPNNYDANAFNLIGYYRDYQWKGSTYSNLNEALVKVVDNGFESIDYHDLNFGLYTYEKNLEFPVDSFAAKRYDYNTRDKFISNADFSTTYAANELVLLLIHDAIRNYQVRTYSFIYQLEQDFIRNHRFGAVKRTNYGDQPVYKISFRRNKTPFQARGSIYIDENSFAIRKLEYAMYKQQFDDDSPSKFNLFKKDLLYEIIVEYQQFQEKMYLNYISFHNQFTLRRPPKFRIDDVNLNWSKQEMKVTFNRPASNTPRRFSVRYKGKKLPIVGGYEAGPSSWVFIFPKAPQKRTVALEALFADAKANQLSGLAIEMAELKDAQGNGLGVREEEVLEQYREFFTQKIEATQRSLFPSFQYVNKNRSLGHPSQHTFPELDTNYWMNTPLRKIDN